MSNRHVSIPCWGTEERYSNPWDTVPDFDRADGPMGRCVNHQRELESERCQEVC